MRVHYNCIGIEKRKYMVIQKENIYVCFQPSVWLKTAHSLYCSQLAQAGLPYHKVSLH